MDPVETMPATDCEDIEEKIYSHQISILTNTVLLMILGVNFLGSRSNILYNTIVSPAVLTLAPLICMSIMPLQDFNEMGNFASWTGIVVALSFVTQVSSVRQFLLLQGVFVTIGLMALSLGMASSQKSVTETAFQLLA
jgi:hypothetical protein